MGFRVASGSSDLEVIGKSFTRSGVIQVGFVGLVVESSLQGVGLISGTLKIPV